MGGGKHLLGEVSSADPTALMEVGNTGDGFWKLEKTLQEKDKAGHQIVARLLGCTVGQAPMRFLITSRRRLPVTTRRLGWSR